MVGHIGSFPQVLDLFGLINYTFKKDHIMISILMNPGQEVLIGLMCLAAMRIYLEIMGFDFLKLPLIKALANRGGNEVLRCFHRMGLIFSIGFIVLFAPQLVLG
jgi:hypothetical protein